ncbi:YciI family protein [Roseomonas eburnea]|uniref:YciI family protein n=2 Tax=Neoroseomonas eburnea TaxID=1346889 RepID=A0A9X9XBI3_9PROT|nr:YciI family protein [Neoroseomonas eburnea]
MLFAVTIEDRTGMAATRRAVRAAHLDWLEQHREMLVIAGPVMDAEGNSIGSVRVIEAPDRAAVEALTAGDPFAKAGCFARVSINPYRIVFKDGMKAE